MLRTIDSAGLDLIKESEGCRLKAYQDVAGIWTIGYGHIAGVQPGTTITQDQADQLLEDDLSDTEKILSSLVGSVPTGNNMFAAMGSLCFNIGSSSFKTSSVLRFHLLGKTAEAADAFLLWDKAQVDGQLRVVAGLLHRRQREQALYLTPDP